MVVVAVIHVLCVLNKAAKGPRCHSNASLYVSNAGVGCHICSYSSQQVFAELQLRFFFVFLYLHFAFATLMPCYPVTPPYSKCDPVISFFFLLCYCLAVALCINKGCYILHVYVCLSVYVRLSEDIPVYIYIRISI